MEDVPHRRTGHPVAEPDQLAVDAAVTPGRVLPCKPNHQAPDNVAGAWSTADRSCSPRVRPARATSPRCHRSGVAGATIRVLRSCRGSRRASAANTNRSFGSNRGRVTWRRSTATSCRSTSSSTSFTIRSRRRISRRPSSVRRAKHTTDKNTRMITPTPAKTPTPRFLSPTRSRSSRRWVKTGPAQDVPYRRGRDTVTEPDRLAMDPAMTPRRILSRKPRPTSGSQLRSGVDHLPRRELSDTSTAARPVRHANPPMLPG